MRYILALLLLTTGLQTAKADWLTWQAPKPDPKQLECLARAIYFEAGNEPEAGRIAVGKVIVNRVNSGKYANSICGVVHQRTGKQCQFTFACVKNAAVRSEEQYANSMAAAELVLLGFAKDITQSAEFFNNRPFRDKRMVHTVKIGGHYFYRPI
jgi:spore germination cell wall hydrolase CwlJ-like protein